MSGRPINRRYAQGQAMPIGLAFIMFVVLATLILYNSSQLVSKKSHIANAADAAAYSGLVWQARALNFQAYTNRAMVANQVSIAQFVSIASWTEYSKVAAQNVDAAIGWIPPVAPFTKGAHQAVVQVDQIIDQVANVVVQVISGVNQILSSVQQAVYYSTFAITPSIVKEVAKANNAEYDVDSAYSVASMGLNAIDWQSFTQRYDGDDLNRKADIINESRDRFTRDRGWEVGRFNMGIMKFQLRKEGMTHLVEEDGEWAWKAKDTLSLHNWRFKCSWKGCKWRHSELPIGWGGAYASNNLQCHGGDCPRWEIHNGRAGHLAEKESGSVNGYGGMQAFYDLADLSAQNQDPRLILRVEVQAPRSSLDTSTQKGYGSSKAVTEATDKNGFGNGMFRLEDNLASNTMASISSAEVYFERPTIHNNALMVDGQQKHEYGSLWNPYWQVRLTATPKEQKFAAWAARDQSLIEGAGGAVDGARAYAQTQQEELRELINLEQYIDSAADELPGMLAERVTAVEGLNNLVTMSQYLEETVARIAAQRREVEESLENSTSRAESIDSELRGLEEELGNAVSDVTRDQIQAQISALTSEKNQIAQHVDDATAHLRDLEDTYQSHVVELKDLHKKSNEIASQVGLLDRDIHNAQDLELLIHDVEELIGQTEGAIAGVDTQVAHEFLGRLSEAESIAASLTGGALEATKDKLADEGKKQIENYIKDQFSEKIEETLVDAIKGAVKGFFGNYTGDFEAFSQKVSDTAESAEAVLNEVSVDYIQPLEEQLASLKQEQAELKGRFQEELDIAVAQMEDDINYYRGLLNEEVDRVTESYESQLSYLVQQEIDAETDAVRQEISEKIEKLEAQKDQEVASIEGSYSQRITNLQNRKQEIIDDFNENLASLKSDVESEIANLEQQIASLKDKLNAG